MRKLCSASLFLLQLTWFGTLWAQDGKRPPEALSRLERAAQAMGVQGGRLSSAAAEGIFIDFDGSESRFRFFGAVDGRARWERETAQGTTTTVLTGRGWGFEVRQGRRIGLPLSRIPGLGLEKTPALAISAWMSSPAHRAAALEEGRVEVGRVGAAGVPPEHADAAAKALRSELEMEPAGGLPAVLRLFRHPGEMRIEFPLELAYSDWRRVDGMLWAHEVEVRLPGSKRVIGRWLFEKVELNSQLREEDFQ